MLPRQISVTLPNCLPPTSPRSAAAEYQTSVDKQDKFRACICPLFSNGNRTATVIPSLTSLPDILLIAPPLPRTLIPLVPPTPDLIIETSSIIPLNLPLVKVWFSDTVRIIPTDGSIITDLLSNISEILHPGRDTSSAHTVPVLDFYEQWALWEQRPDLEPLRIIPSTPTFQLPKPSAFTRRTLT